MTPLTLQHVAQLEELLAAGTPPRAAFEEGVGGTAVSDGLWRFYSDSWPKGSKADGHGVGSQLFLRPSFFAFGEDVFGNQLVFGSDSENAVLLNHENGESFDLLLTPLELLRTALESGIDWIDVYSDGSLEVARRYGPVPLDMHLHWTTPLFLGGQVNRENLSLVEREAHLVGHAKIWAQVSDLPSGAAVILKQ